MDSAPGEGSCFEVLLPLSAGPAPDDAEQAAAALSPATDGEVRPADACHILCAEDDDQVAGEVMAVLTDAGYRVTRAVDGDRAMALALAGTFDLIISDVIMPGISGPAMVARLRARGVATPVLFLSGYTDDRLRSHGFEPGSVSLLRKPFELDVLRREVALKLSERPLS